MATSIELGKEKRSNSIYIASKGSILANNEVFYGPYDSLEDAVDYITEFCLDLDILQRNIPLGITVAVYDNMSKTSITEYINDKRVLSNFSINDFSLKNGGNSSSSIEYQDFYNGNDYEYIDIM